MANESVPEPKQVATQVFYLSSVFGAKDQAGDMVSVATMELMTKTARDQGLLVLNDRPRELSYYPQTGKIVLHPSEEQNMDDVKFFFSWLQKFHTERWSFSS